MTSSEIEYPDAAGYPDGKGFLDEGTAAAAADTPSPLVAELEIPSADVDDAIVVTADASAFHAVMGGREVAIMHISRDGGQVTITSTVVDPEVRQRGIATAFIAHVLDQLRDERAEIVVECSEVVRFIDLHPEYSVSRRR